MLCCRFTIASPNIRRLGGPGLIFRRRACRTAAAMLAITFGGPRVITRNTLCVALATTRAGFAIIAGPATTREVGLATTTASLATTATAC